MQAGNITPDALLPLSVLSPVHTKDDNYKDNYKDNDIRAHTSERYRPFIQSSRASAGLNS